MANEVDIISEIQLILAEKRTSLASLRTGIAVFALPLAVLALLVATSKYYEPLRIWQFLMPLLVLCAGLALLGAFLVIQSLHHIRCHDRIIQRIKRECSAIARYLR
jgi:uncharacterized membrane protein YidH (DUF202 family)